MSANVRVGVDVLLRERFHRLARHPRYRSLLFTAAELDQAPAPASAQRVEEYLAGRFAAKEAVAKVLGTGFLRGIVWHDIEVLRDPRGGPYVNLGRSAQEAADANRLSDISVSITHQGPVVVSVAAGLST
ncbi:DNA-binding protein [Catellatospora sp. TT07R-123]|uniref:holo-ACP synthase n=1 Tax=Catellatospora sp. TT07R-123 TaxID=2733863 RepID=UPI001B1A0AEE|nr:holo-ACP synthase [Catellatospora sp. TT07R-123]GHJ48862.1 DNA-binding protein [Catellatospora sp. TT07R-123]